MELNVKKEYEGPENATPDLFPDDLQMHIKLETVIEEEKNDMFYWLNSCKPEVDIQTQEYLGSDWKLSISGEQLNYQEDNKNVFMHDDNMEMTQFETDDIMGMTQVETETVVKTEVINEDKNETSSGVTTRSKNKGQVGTKDFAHQETLKAHKRTRKSNTSSRSDRCPKIVANIRVNPKRNHRKQKCFNCILCNEPSNQRKQLLINKRNKIVNKNENCASKTSSRSDCCPKIVANIRVNPKRNRRKQKCLNCIFCNEPSNQKKHLLIKQKNKIMDKNEKCAKDFGRKKSLSVKPSKRKTFECQICTKTFNAKWQLEDHRTTHSGKKQYLCEKCGESFKKKDKLKIHEKVHLRKKDNLESHQRLHTGKKSYTCETCNKAFSEKRNMIVHQRTHTGEKPFKCSTCSKAFNDIRTLARHLKIHGSGRKRNCKCENCGKGFYSKADLKVHQRIHSGIKPCKCNTCGKSFYVNADLQRHMRVHTGEKPFKCEICERAFTLKGELTRHTRIHSGEKPYQCEFCYQAFCVKSNLTKHRQSHKKDNSTFPVFKKATSLEICTGSNENKKTSLSQSRCPCLRPR